VKVSRRLCTNSNPAGRLKFFGHEWQKITSDRTILSYVTGCQIDFQTIPVQFRTPKNIPFSQNEIAIISGEIEKLVEKGVIETCTNELGEYVSNIFIRPKKNGTHRLILNLKSLNEDVDYHHFKMDTVHTCVALMTRGCFMASLDLRDAYYSVPIHTDHQKYLKFIWNEQLYKFVCLPNGLASAPRIFTKLLKPVYAHLRQKGHISSPYLDDSFLLAYSYAECVNNVHDTLNMLKKLGFIIHEEKSQLRPCQKIEHLGFVFDSLEMTVTVNTDKIAKLRDIAKSLLAKKTPTIRQVAQLIGTMVSCFPGVEYGQLFYRRLEMLKAFHLKVARGDFEARMHLSPDTKDDIKWWIHNVGMGKQISHGVPDLDIKTDASFKGWGAVTSFSQTGGRWNQSEIEGSINVLEMKAVFFGLKALCSLIRDTHIKVLTDNTTTVAYINHMGGSISPACNDTARDIWLWCIEQNNWLTATHIPGKLNVEADAESRTFSDDTEWKLCTKIFELVCARFGEPDVDLFASRTNYQCKPYVAWRPDPEADQIDAFTVDWGQYNNVYIFPPFSLLTRVLQKMRMDGASGIVIAPEWPTQPWYSQLLQMTTAKLMMLPVSTTTLTLTHAPEAVHPLAHKLRLMACRL